MKKWGGVAAIVIAVFLFLGLGWYWFSGRQARVLAGFAHPTFPYSDYSMEELGTMFPQYVENNAPTVQSPEETHQKFLTALKKGDFEEAVRCCFAEGERERMKSGLEKVKQSGDLLEMIKNLDTKITIGKNQDINNGVSSVTYYYYVLRDGQKIGSTIDFLKSKDGIWYIESL